MKSFNYDILIIGGGLVGASLALNLRNSDYRVALVEAHPYTAPAQPSFDERSLALAYGASRILQRMGCWDAMQAQAEPIQEIHVSDRGRLGLMQMTAAEENMPALGYVVPAWAYGAAVMPQIDALVAAETSALTLYCPARLTDLQTDATKVVATITNADGDIQLQAQCLVAADGASSKVRQLLDIQPLVKQYGQSAIVANLTTQLPHQNIAYERFTTTGPVAILPLKSMTSDTQRDTQTKPRSALIWTVPDAQLESLLALDDAQFLEQIQQRFGYRLGRLLSVGQRTAYPLALVDNHCKTQSRIVFIGNAAQSVHPVAGQGFNLALRDIAMLIDTWLHPQRVPDPGAEQLLQGYEQQRQVDRQRVIRFTDSLVNIFGTELPPIPQIRALSLTALDLWPTLRREFLRRSINLNMPLSDIPVNN